MKYVDRIIPAINKTSKVVICMGLEEFYNYTSGDERHLFNEIADQLVELGRAKTKDVNYVFTNSKTPKNVLKFSIEKGKPILKMKFFASSDYSNFFHECIRKTVEEFNFRYTGCYNCGRCKDKLEGYEYTYADGRKYFRCGTELISIYGISLSEVDEVIRLFKAKHEYYLSKR